MTMNKFWLSSLIIFLLFCVCNAQNKSQKFEWKEFVSEEGRFKAIFPFVPTKSIKESEGWNRKIQSTRFEISLAEPEIYMGVMYADHPNVQVMNDDMLKAHYDSIRDGMLKMANAELVSEREVRASGKLGRELTLKTGNVIVKYRTYLVGNRQYQIITSTKSPLMEDLNIKKDIEKFLNSFQLTEK